MPAITKIVITGGPCAGKTAAMSWIKEAFTREGYTVLFVPETATEFISGGVAPWTCGTNVEYQKCQVTLQLEKERLFHQAAMTMPQEKILIVCDRGGMDNRCYMDDREFQEVLQYVGITEVELRDRYDAIFHLTTAAKGVTDAYTLSNNAARIETPEEATALDDKGIAAWTGHPHLRIIANNPDFEVKMRHLIEEISAFLDNVEIERKYLIEYPDLAWLESNPHCRSVEIAQTYLLSEPGEETRIRQRGMDGHFVYYKTTKRTLSDATREEIETQISAEEYLALLKKADPGKRPLHKTRWCLVWNSRYYEIDLYPFWNDKALLELELTREDEEVILPPQLKVIREVTGDPAYKNSTLAAL